MQSILPLPNGAALRLIYSTALGNFDFSFSPSIRLPGTRYDIAMTANKADVTTEARLVLYQRQG